MMKNDPKLFQDQTIIIQMISTGAPLKKILSFIVNSIEKHCLAMHTQGLIMMYNPKTGQLEQTVSSSLPQIYIRTIEPLNVGPYEGANGAAAFFKRPVIVSDVENEIIFRKYKGHAFQAGIRSCVSVPIVSSKSDLLGTFTLYFKEIYSPSSEIMEILDFYNQLATIAIECSLSQKNNEAQQTVQWGQGLSFEPTFQMKNSSLNPLLGQLNQALERSEFEVYYQPYYGLEKEMKGLEALIRWNHPTSGILSPASFLGIAEETGLILEIEHWVLTEAIKQVKQLHRSGMEDLRLSVNISAKQFGNEDFPEKMAGILDELSFSPEKLTLEVTERFLISENTFGVVNRLKDSGVRISIDDFGVSYSSLQYLKDLAVDEIKIDRTFISNMEKDVTSQKIVEMIIMLGHQLNLNIVAEGVERENQLEILKNLRCDVVQGFLFSKPLPFENFEDRVLKQQIM